MVAVAVPLTESSYSLRDRNNVAFGAYVYGADSDNCAYAFPAGMHLIPHNETSSTAQPISTIKSTEGPVTVKTTAASPDTTRQPTVGPVTKQPTVKSTPGPATPESSSPPRPSTGRPVVSSSPRPSTGRPVVSSSPRPSTGRPEVSTTSRPSTDRPGVGSTSKPSTTRPGVRSTARPSTSRPGAPNTMSSLAGIASTARPEVGSTARPTSRPGVGSTARPSTSRPGAPTTMSPSADIALTGRPGVGSTARPSTARPGVGSTARPSTARPGVGSTARPSTARPGVGSTARPSTSQPGAPTTMSPSADIASTARPGIGSTARPGVGSTDRPGVGSTARPGLPATTLRPLSREFKCPDDLAGYYEDLADCNKFYQCASGVASRVTCPNDLHFSVTVAGCLPPNDASCEPPNERADNLGTTFYLLFLATEPANTQQVQILLTTPMSTPVDVNITAPPSLFRSVQVKKGQVETVHLPASLRSNEPGRANKTVHVSANGKVSVSALNRGSCGNYLPVPLEMLGDTYYVMTWASSSGFALISILPVQEDTIVSVTVGGVEGVNVKYEGTVYRKGETLQVTLAQYESITLQSSADLTGTYVVGSKPLAVFAGNTEITIGSGNLKDQLVSQFTPVNTWGYHFALAPFPGSTSGYYIKYLAKDANTVVTIVTSSGRNSKTLNKGEYFVMDVVSSELAWIQSTNQILVVQYAKSQTGPSDLTAPASLLIPPVEQYTSDYIFTVFNATSIYVMIVIEKIHLNGLVLDGLPVNASAGWQDIADSEPLMSSRYVRVLDGAHRLRHRISNTTFGAYVYGFTPGDCAYAVPAGMNLLTINKTDHSTSRPTSRPSTPAPLITSTSPPAGTTRSEVTSRGSTVRPTIPNTQPSTLTPTTRAGTTKPSRTGRPSTKQPVDSTTGRPSSTRPMVSRTGGPSTERPVNTHTGRPSSTRPMVSRTGAPSTQRPGSTRPTKGPQLDPIVTRGPPRTTIPSGTVRPTSSGRPTTPGPTRPTTTQRPTRPPTTQRPLTTTTLRPCDCSKLTVKSTKLQPSFAGQYTRLDDPLNGRPVYKHTTLNRFLYLVDAQTKFWLFGTEQGKNRGLILAHSDAEEPSQVKTSWRAYDSSDMTWKDDDTVSLQCDCQASVCEKLTIGGHMFYNSIPGEFTRHTNDFSGRPAYENKERGLYFYYYMDSNDQFWVVGTKLGAKVGLVFNYDSARNPGLVTATWVSLQGGHWVVDPDVQLQCV